jgi:hypothetical protein
VLAITFGPSLWSLSEPESWFHNWGMNRAGSVAALILMSLFALPFGGLGAALFLKDMALLGQGHPHAIRGAVAGALFMLVSILLVSAVVIGARKLQRIERRKAEHPAEPWLWREDWARGQANGTSGSNLLGAWIRVVLYNAIAWIAVIFIPWQQHQRKPVTFILWLFPLVGFGVLIWAIHKTRAHYQFGKTFLELTTLPASLGCELRATIHARFPPGLQEDVRIELSCVHVTRYTIGRKGDGPMEEILWRQEETISSASASLGPSGTVIPVSFHVPLNQPQTDTAKAQAQIVWRLQVRANVPGGNYKDVFEIPVFRTKDSPESEGAQFVAISEEEAPIQAPVHPTIIVRPAAEGGTEFYFSAARNPAIAAGLTAFMAVWTVGIVVMLRVGAPAFIACAFALFALPFLYFMLGLWFRTSRVVAQSGTLMVRNGWIGIGKTQMIPASDIEDLRAEITLRQGGDAAATNYYSVRAVLHTARTVTLGENVRDKEEAKWLVAEMRRIVGIKP